MKLLVIYLVLVNAAGFYFMLADKQKAIKKQWRIPEATLLGIALIGGSLGIALGMGMFRHKTRKPAFLLGVPTLLAMQTWLVVLLIQ